MGNSLIMMATTTSSSVLANGIIPLTTITRRRGQVINSNGDSIVLRRPGYYKVNATITFEAPAAGDVTIKAQKNDVDINGMTASSSITTEIQSLSLSGIVRVTCSDGIGILTLVNSGVAITTSNVEIDVEYLS